MQTKKTFQGNSSGKHKSEGVDIVSKEKLLEREFKIPLTQTPELTKPARMLSETPPFPFSKKLYESAKTVFNYVACDNKFEESFAQFLHNAEDVEAFAKIPQQFGFSIQYTDTRANIRHTTIPIFQCDCRLANIG